VTWTGDEAPLLPLEVVELAIELLPFCNCRLCLRDCFGEVDEAAAVVFTALLLAVGLTICLYWMIVLVAGVAALDVLVGAASIDIFAGVIGKCKLSACSFC